jgi:hypothetical protein
MFVPTRLEIPEDHYATHVFNLLIAEELNRDIAISGDHPIAVKFR